MAKALANAAELPKTAKLTDGARSLRMTPKEFRKLCAKHSIPILRPTERRELILEDHLKQIVYLIAQPALRSERQAA